MSVPVFFRHSAVYGAESAAFHAIKCGTFHCKLWMFQPETAALSACFPPVFCPASRVFRFVFRLFCPIFRSRRVGKCRRRRSGKRGCRAVSSEIHEKNSKGCCQNPLRFPRLFPPSGNCFSVFEGMGVQFFHAFRRRLWTSCRIQMASRAVPMRLNSRKGEEKTGSGKFHAWWFFRSPSVVVGWFHGGLPATFPPYFIPLSRVEAGAKPANSGA